MKKLSKILVIVLTLAMLLGVVVVSASASDKKVDVLGPDGSVIASTDSLDEALATANGNTTVGDITVKLNSNVSLANPVTITRDADEYGKVIIDLGGFTLTTSSVSNKYTALGTAIHKGSGLAEVVDVIYVKANADAAAAPYYKDTISFDGTITDAETGATVAADALVAGKTYIGTLTAVEAGSGLNVNHAIPTLTFKRGAFNVGAGASLEVVGNGSNVTRGSNAILFYIENDAVGAELYVSGIKINSASAHFAQINGGKATFDNCYLYANESCGLIRHGGGELDIKNSYLYMPICNGANLAMIRTQGTNAAKAADGYHIEITNTTVISSSSVFASANTSLSACASAYSHVQPDGSSSTRKTFYAPHEIPLYGEDYVNTDILVENSNLEMVNYNSRARNDNIAIVGNSGFMNFDFKKTNLIAAQHVFYYGMAHPEACTVNLYDCYLELTGKGNLNNQTNAAFVYAATSVTFNFYNTEFAVSDTYVTNGNPKGGSAITPTTVLLNYGKMYFYAGCKFNAACAPNTDALKARISGGKYLVNDAGEMIVLGMDFSKTDVAGKLTVKENTGDALTAGATSGAFNPIVVLSGGKAFTEAGATTTSRQTFKEIDSKGWNIYTSQGIQRVVEEADGNKYVCYDPSYVKNDMSSYSAKYTTTLTDVTLPSGVTEAVGGWDIDGDSVIEYLNTDDNANDAEYVNISASGYSWSAIPDSYDKNYVSSAGTYWTIGNQLFFMPNYQYVTLSFDYKNAEGSDYFLPLQAYVQGRREFSAGSTGVGTDSGAQGFRIERDGNVAVNGTVGAKLNFDSWNNITFVVEIKEESVAAGTGILIAAGTRGDVVYTNSVVHVFVNGEKAGKFTANFNAGHGYVSGLRGSLNNSCDATAIAGGAQMHIDNIREIGYAEGYESAELSALLAGTETDLDTWSESIFALHENEIKGFPAEKTPVAEMTVTPPVASATWSTYSNSDTTRFETAVRATTFYFDNAEDAIAHAGYGEQFTVKLLADAEKVLVNAPATVDTNGKTITYYSNEYKGTLDSETGILTFAKATAADLIEVTYGYADEEGEITETFIKGGHFWLDTDRIPTILKKFVESEARDVKLAYNGTKLDAINPADYAQGQLVSEENNRFVFTYELDKQYGWMILDASKQFSGLSADIGESYAELAARIEVIEKPLDFSKVDVDLVTDGEGNVVLTNGKPTLVDAYTFDDNTAKLRVYGYTIKLFADFEDASRLYSISYGAEKVVNYDLNGHTVTYNNGIILAFGAEMAHEYDPTGHIVQVHGTYINNGMPTNWYTKQVQSADNAVYYFNDNALLTVNIISSATGAKIINTATSTPVIDSNRQEKLYYKNSSGTSVTLDGGYSVPTTNLGNPTTSTAIGPDENVIDVVSRFVYNLGHYAGNGSVRNINAYGGRTAGMISATNGKTTVTNSNFFYDNAAGSVIQLNTGTQLFDMKRCNIISNDVVTLFSHAGNRGETTSNYVSISDSRLFNTKLDGNDIGYGKTGGATDRRVSIVAGCYYNIDYTPNNKVTLRPNVTTTTTLMEGSTDIYVPYYTANVYANETFTINGVDYTFTYKVAADADVVNVNWADNGGNVFATDKYVNGAQLVYNRASDKYDDITRSKYVFENLPKASADLTVNAVETKLIPGFAVKSNINLETNFKHNIKIFRYVTDAEGNLVDAYANITSVTIGGAPVELTLNLGADEIEGTDDDYYYYTVNVKSNAIVDTYELVINFNALDGTPVTATQTLSVTKYLEQGFAAEAVGGDLYNMYASIVNYGIASYKNFADTALGDVAELEALAAKHSAPVIEVPEAEAGAAGDKLDVEFVLDEKLEYRFYLVGIGAENINMSNITITYTTIDGVEREFSTSKRNLSVENDGENYWVDFTVPAYNFLADINIVVDNAAAAVNADVTYNLASYYADAAGSSAELIALVEAMYNYAYYANAYMLNK